MRAHTVGVCPACGHGQVLDPPEDPGAIYGEAYFEGGADDGYAAYGATEPVLRREFRRSLARLRRHVPGGRLVEIGCAYGVFLDEARASFDVVGIEISRAAAARAQARGLDVVCGAADPRVLAARGPFDAAVLLDVIEHLADPSGVLRALARILRPGAAVMLTTGDFGSILARAAGRRWRLMTPPQHLHFFTRTSLGAALARAELRIVSVRRPTKLVPVALAAYQLARVAGPAAPLARRLARRVPSGAGVPVNLFDTVEVIATRA